MDIATGASRGFVAAIALLACGAAQAQQETEHAKPSPYSLALDTTHSGPGLTLSVVGRAQMSQSFGVFGRVGTTTYARPDTSAMGMTAAPVTDAMSWGGGVSYDFTPRLSATLEWISYDLRVANGPLRSANLGLKYRY
ncbi:MAG TPA: hypothetical protein VL593_05870 [Ramlibacter sp.]|jgi:hypothetical protein|nr:hypothetical protein [Ramlibacter sp.]